MTLPPAEVTRILGIDPGVSETGWAVVEGGRGAGAGTLMASGLLRTSPRDLLPARLLKIHEGLREILREHKPDGAAVEEMFFLKAAHTIRATLQARGVVLLAAAQAGVPVREYNPREVKSALTGSGAAAKAQMQRMVQAALSLPEPLRPDDVADAAAIALCHLRSGRLKNFVVLDRLGGPR